MRGIFLILIVSCFSLLPLTSVKSDGKDLKALKESYVGYFHKKDYKKGLPLAKTYAERVKEKKGEISDDYAKALNNIALFHLALTENKHAQATFQKALSVAEQIDKNHKEAVFALKHLVKIAKRQNNKRAASFFQSQIKAIERRQAASEKRAPASFMQDDYVVVPVFYATDRNNTGNKDPKRRYGVIKSKNPINGYLEYGVAKVSIPGGDNHQIGQLESPSVLKFEWHEDPAKHVVLLEVGKLAKDDYFKQLQAKIGSSQKQNAFLFIHGYRVTFEDAARRTAQIAYDLKFKGAPIFYSWPSKGTLFGYTPDSTAVEWTEPHLERFIIDFLNRTSAKNIYLIAHSMGNRAMTRVMAKVAQNHPTARTRIKEIILAAPDIDADVFKEVLAPQIIKNYTNITLYASSKDLALKASEMFWGRPRAGDAGEQLVLMPGVETIDATKIDSSLLGHSYIANSDTLLKDMIELFKSGKRAQKREWLQEKRRDNLPYWVFP